MLYLNRSKIKRFLIYVEFYYVEFVRFYYVEFVRFLLCGICNLHVTTHHTTPSCTYNVK